MARYSTPLLATSAKTAFPIVPLAPVTKYMVFPPEDWHASADELRSRKMA